MTDSVRVVGCDVGKSGSIVLVRKDDSGIEILDSYRLKETGTPLNDWCQQCKRRWHYDAVYCEKVASRTGQGVCSVFSFGESNGAAKQALALLGEEIELITPQKWQKHFGLVFPKELGLTKTEKKNKHKQYVLDNYGLDLVHAEVDAFLIAVYGAERVYLERRNN